MLQTTFSRDFGVSLCAFPRQRTPHLQCLHIPGSPGGYKSDGIQVLFTLPTA